MSDVIISPNMNLSIPIVGQEPGPDWATDINNCFNGIDTHDHSSGKGVPITPAGLNINADLPFTNNNAISIRTVRFQANPSIGVSDLDALFVNGVDLYYVDGNGNQVRITQSGAVAGTPGSIANLVPPASASYIGASSKFVFQSNANTAADIDGRNFIFRNAAANSKGLTLQPPLAMGSDYSITLPTLPGTTNFMTIDPSGAIGSVNLIAPQNLTPLGEQISASCGLFGTFGPAPTTQGTALAVTNLSVTITSTGRPIFIGLIQDGSTNQSFFGASNLGSPTLIQVNVVILRGATVIADIATGVGFPGGPQTFSGVYTPVSSISTVDVIGGGTYIYSVSVYTNISSNGIAVNNAKLIAYEL